MGRDAWIDTKKRELVGSIKADLDRGFYTEDFLREHSISGDVGIDQEAYLNHEEGLKENALPPEIQATVDAWVATPTGSHERMRQTERLKAVIESRYPAITADIGQLEKSLLRLERGLISSEVGTIEAKLNVFDIGRIEQGNGKRKEGWFVGMADSVSDAVNNSALPDWMKQKVA